jgi:hypothetical protein
MALTIEDGTGIDGAHSFLTVAEFEQIQSDYFGAPLEGIETEKEAALRRAWLYMLSLGWKADYPEFGGTIPANIKIAQAILARTEQEEPGALQPSVTPGQQKILTQVGDIGWEFIGAKGADAQRRVVTMADDLLKPYLHGSGSTRFLARG